MRPQYTSLYRNVGKRIRSGHILADDGKTLIVAIDHGMTGVTKDIEDMEKVVEDMIEAGADAVMINFGAAKRLADKIAGRISLILSIPYDPKYVELAVKIGADAVKTTYFGRIPLNADMMEKVSAIARSAEDWGMPYLVELVPTDESGKILYDAEKIRQAVRIGGELGGDLVKTAYVAPKSTYEEIIESSLVPVVVMGGPKMESIKDFLSMIRDAVDAGAIGGAIGRNIWGHEIPERMAKAVSGIIHEDKSVEEALKILEGLG